MMEIDRVKGTNSVKKQIYQRMIELTNRPTTSQLLKRFTMSPVSKFIVPSFQKTFQIDTTVASKKQHEYTSLHDFFTRQLLQPARPIDSSTTSLVSPVDAKIESHGVISEQGTFLVKGQEYSVDRLVVRQDISQRFIGGEYTVLYLSPADYHRIHAPLSAEVTEQYASGGFSYPVNRLGLTYGKKPISDNYRIVSLLERDNKQLAMIKVGAMFVNTIELLETDTKWTKGQEVAYFAFGSTVVLLTERDTVNWRENMQAGRKVQVGEPLGDML